MNYGQILKSLREEQNMTQEDIANYLDIKRSSYKQFELQYDIIPIIRLNQLANYFSVSIDYIIGLNNTKNYPSTKDNMDIKLSAQRLKELRKEKNISQQKLSQFLNADRSVLSHYERGRNFISTSFLYDICKKYKISADYLLGKIDEPKYLK